MEQIKRALCINALLYILIITPRNFMQKHVVKHNYYLYLPPE